jgi:molybdopterin converting factor small subunit
MAKIIIPTPLRKFTGNQSTFNVDGQNVQAAIANLVTANPKLAPHILDKNQQIRSFIRIYVGDEDINSLEGSETAISSETIVSIVPAIAGGSF